MLLPSKRDHVIQLQKLATALEGSSTDSCTQYSNIVFIDTQTQMSLPLSYCLANTQTVQKLSCSCVIWTCVVVAVCTDPSWLYQLSACALI